MNAVHSAVGRVAEDLYGNGRHVFWAKRPLNEHVHKGIRDRGGFYLEGHVDKSIGLDTSGRLGKENGGLGGLSL
jgi:hypothetical protein